MTETRDLAVRTRKARRASACALCPAIVTAGQPIGLVRAGWAHVTCVVDANREQMAAAASERAQLRVLMTTPPQPSERLGSDHQADDDQAAER